MYVCGCQNYGPFLGTLNIRGRITIGTQKGTIILTTTHVGGCYCGSTWDLRGMWHYTGVMGVLAFQMGSFGKPLSRTVPMIPFQLDCCGVW